MANVHKSFQINLKSISGYSQAEENRWMFFQEICFTVQVYSSQESWQNEKLLPAFTKLTAKQDFIQSIG